MYMLKYIKLNSGNLRKIYELKHIKKILFAYVLIIYENIKHISRINVDFREKIQALDLRKANLLANNFLKYRIVFSYRRAELACKTPLFTS